MTSDPQDEIVLRLPRDVARFVERTLWDVAEHIAGGREIVPGPRELELELAALMWDLRETLGDGHSYDGKRPSSTRTSSYVVG
jgi:hypothetical protein